MTVRCARCKKVTGEKCGRCGSEDVRREFNFEHEVDFWRCFGCRATWLPESEGTSHGYCEACYEVAMGEIKTPDSRKGAEAQSD